MSTSAFHVRRSGRATGLLAAIVLMTTLASCGGGGGGGDGGITPPGGGGGGGGGGPVVTTSVSMRNTAFVPPAISVSPQATVQWTNEDGIEHNVTFDNSAVGSIGSFSSGTASTRMPAAAGTYTYHCTLHPGMNGSVRVQ